MKKIALFCSGLLVSTGAALAADPTIYSPTPAYDWSGLWVGVNLGGVSGSVTGTILGGATTSGPSGTDIDVHASYSWQSGNWVYGPFIAIPFGNPSGSASGGYTIKVNWGAVGGFSVGYAMDRWLPYAFVAGVLGSATVSQGATSSSNTHAGYVLGVGLNYGLTDRWSVGARYAYVSTDQKVYAANSPNPTGWNAHSLVASLNFKLY